MLDNLEDYNELESLNFNLKDAIDQLMISRKQVKSSTIRCCFRHAGFDFESTLIDVEEVASNSNQERACRELQSKNLVPHNLTFDDFVNLDDDLVT